MATFKLQYLMSKPTAGEVAAQELAEAEIALLEAQTAEEWARSVVAYNTARITRLRKHLLLQGGKP